MLSEFCLDNSPYPKVGISLGRRKDAGHGRGAKIVADHIHYNRYSVYIYIWGNYNDLTATSLESWLVREIIPKWP